jgi:CDP-diacylglycerol--glycerol-3-phosphate 3-phosphatidyltransferase
MTIYDLKPAFQNALRPLCRWLAAMGVTANQVTVAAVLLSFALGALVALFPDKRWPLLCIPVGLFVRMALNAIDGMLAREYAQATPLGLYLNELSDVVSDAALILPFALLPGANPSFVITVMGLALLTEMAGVLGVLVGASRRHDGPLGKSDRALALGVLGLLIGLGHSEAALSPAVWTGFAALAVVTVIRRIRHGLAECSPQ